MKYKYLVIYEYAHDEDGKSIKNSVTQFTIKQKNKAEKFRKVLQDEHDALQVLPQNMCAIHPSGGCFKYKISKSIKRIF